VLVSTTFCETEKNGLADEMDKIAISEKIAGFRRDGKNVRDSDAVVLIGVRGTISLRSSNCGACGYNTCREFDEHLKSYNNEYVHPNCMFKIIDLGIALCSAAKLASTLNVDNRIMYRVGVAARRLNLLREASIIMGIPISAKGKNIYFDRERHHSVIDTGSIVRSDISATG
jgi:uncharacterized ferredoxin-like protein